MKYETQDRRQHPRADDTLTKIEDLTYSVLRKSAAEPGSVQHESARISGRMSYAIFLLVPVLAIPLIAILCGKLLGSHSRHVYGRQALPMHKGLPLRMR